MHHAWLGEGWYSCYRQHTELLCTPNELHMCCTPDKFYLELGPQSLAPLSGPFPAWFFKCNTYVTLCYNILWQISNIMPQGCIHALLLCYHDEKHWPVWFMRQSGLVFDCDTGSWPLGLQEGQP